nr:hypothetical protein [Tanacetum cinerariifolium]
MAKKSVLPNNVGKVFTRLGRIPVSVVKPKVAASTSAAKPVNTARPKQSVHFSKSRSTFYKSHSPIRRSFYNATTHSRRISTKRVNTVRSKTVSVVEGNRVTAVKTSVGYVWRPRVNELDHIFKDNMWIYTSVDYGHLQQALPNIEIINSGCSRHMTGYKAYLTDYQEINDGGFVAFGLSRECIVLSPNFKLLDESQVLLRIPRQRNMYSFDLQNVVPTEDLTCLFAKASIDKSNLWHRRLGHVNFKTINKLVKGILLRGLPSKIFENDHTCVACQKGKKHKAPFNTAYYVLNRALVTKSHNKTPYELLNSRTPRLDFMRPFGCPVTIVNIIDPFGKFKGKADEGFLVGYSITIKAFRVFNTKTRKVEENLHVSTQDNVGVAKEVFDQHYIVLPLWSSISSTFKSSDDKAVDDKPKDDTEKEASNAADALRKEFKQGCMDQRGATKAGSTNLVNTVINPVNAASTSGTFSAGGPSSPHPDPFVPTNTLLHVDQDDSQIPDLEETAKFRSTGIFNSSYDDDLDIFTSLIQSVSAEADFNNINSSTIVNQSEEGIFISQDKYVPEILKKFYFSSVKTASTPIETQNPLMKDKATADVDDHLYRSMIRSLMYLTASRPDIMFAVCACLRFQVTPKLSHLHAVKRILRYLKGQPKLGLWYPRDSPFELEAYSDSDYVGVNLDRKSTTGEYIAAANCCGQVLWIQNHMLDYGFNFMNTKIYIDKESTICIVKNLVLHSKTKHIEIRHHFIRDSYKKKLI